jgi:hypothetical protein
METVRNLARECSSETLRVRIYLDRGHSRYWRDFWQFTLCNQKFAMIVKDDANRLRAVVAI